jgi:SAM-dependent methyltransferase
MGNLVSTHYDQAYFSWQSSIGEFGGWANQPLFAQYVHPGDTVLDFGCGGGWLLKNISCMRRLGVEVNPSAAEVAQANGLEIYSAVKDVPDAAADVIFSNHALEHTLHPLYELQALRSKLRQDGRIIFIIPCETGQADYRHGDVNYHLYTWNPMCLGNLFTEAGYIVDESKPLMHKWSLRFRGLAKLKNRKVFDLACWLYAHLERSSFQVRVVAHI